MSAHVTALCRSGFFQLWLGDRQADVYLSGHSLRKLPKAFISCRVDYCNSLLYGVTDNITRKVQSLQNAAARLITGARRRDHITPVLRQLHWLPVRHRVDFKLACLVADDIRLVSEGNRRSLRSSFDNICAVPRTYNSFGDRSFGVAGPRIWNSLPRGLRTFDTSYKHSKTPLKTYVSLGHGALRHLYVSALEILLLTYLVSH